MIGIYKITNMINNQSYIGQSINIETRWNQHVYAGTHGYKKGKLYSAIFQYGVENFSFEIIEECPLESKILNERERYWISYYESFQNGYNCTPGGQGEDSWVYDPILIRQLWDEGYSFGEIVKIVGCSKGIVQLRLKGYNDYNPHTSHSRGAIYAMQQGKMSHLQFGQQYYFSNEQRIFFTNNIPVHQYNLNGEYIASYNSLSEAARALGKNNPGCESNIGRIFRENNNQRLAYGYQWSKEKVEKMPPAPVHMGKLVQCIETGQIFHSTIEAAQWCGLKSSSPIKDYCRGNNTYKSAGRHPETGEKLHWKYIE